MPDYQIKFARSARKELESLGTSDIQRIYSSILSLRKDPCPRGCLKLKGPVNLWRVRCGVYRIVYSIDDARLVVDVIRIRHRKDE